jgi:hypothetical protein
MDPGVPELKFAPKGVAVPVEEIEELPNLKVFEEEDPLIWEFDGAMVVLVDMGGLEESETNKLDESAPNRKGGAFSTAVLVEGATTRVDSGWENELAPGILLKLSLLLSSLKSRFFLLVCENILVVLSGGN